MRPRTRPNFLEGIVPCAGFTTGTHFSPRIARIVVTRSSMSANSSCAPHVELL